MVAGCEEIAESLNKCVKSLATAAEALQNLGNETGNQKPETDNGETINQSITLLMCQVDVAYIYVH